MGITVFVNRLDSVVYFDQRLDAAHAKRWSKYAKNIQQVTFISMLR